MNKIQKVARIIDHTNIEVKATKKDIINTCREAVEYGFRGVCVNPEWVKTAKEELKDTNIHVVCLLDPPIGDSLHSKRKQMCKKAVKDGADDLDIVIPICDVKHQRWGKVLKELKEICAIGHVKVIIGSGFLTDEEIKKASQTCKKAKAICVKTATFADPLEYREIKEKAVHIKLMKENAKNLLIKASGKIRTLKDLKMMVKAGADIIGSSNSVSIIKEIK